MRIGIKTVACLALVMTTLVWFVEDQQSTSFDGTMFEVIPFGFDEAFEERLSGLFFRSVDRQGIRCRFQVEDSASSNISDTSTHGVEIFLDLRTWGKRGRVPCEAGVWHLSFFTNGESGPSLESKGAGSKLDLKQAKMIDYVFSRTKRGWELNLRIPWGALDIDPQHLEDVNMAWRLTGSSGQRLGSAESNGNKLDTDPILFDTVPVNSDVTVKTRGWLAAREVSINNESYLHVRIIRPLQDYRLPAGVVAFEIGNYRESIPLRYSAGRKFAIAECFVPTTTLAKGEQLTAPLALHANGPDAWTESLMVEFPMHAWQGLIRKRISDEAIGALEDSTRRLFVEYLRQMALEVTAQMTTEPSTNRPRQHQLRFVRDENYYKNIIDFFTTKALEIARNGAGNMDGKYYFWRSHIDGTVQCIKILLPVPPAGNEVSIEFHGKIQEPLPYRDALRLIEEQAGEVPKFQGKMITLQLWGRGNKSQIFGEEEFMEAINLAKRLAKSSRPKILLRGCSVGASDALAYSLRHPDLVNAVDIRSGFYEPVEARSYSGIGPGESYILSNLYAFDTQLERLQHMTGRILAGDKDVGSTVATQLLAQKLIDINKGIRIEIIPNGSHSSVSELPQWLPPWRDSGRRLVFSNGNIKYLRSSGMRIERLEKFGEPWKITRDDFSNRSRLQLWTRNIAALTLSRSQGDAWRTLSLDEQNLTLADGDSCYEKDFAGKWHAVSEFAPPARKSTLCSGPIGDIFNRSCVIVYGTRDLSAKNAMAARAYHLAKNLSDLYQGGLRFSVLSDGEFDANARDLSVWLIGDETQNAAYSALKVSPDFKFESGRLWFAGKSYGTGGVVTLNQIIPRPDSSAQYVYIEASNSPEGYAGSDLEGTEYDYVITERRDDGTHDLWRGFRDAVWQTTDYLQYSEKMP